MKKFLKYAYDVLEKSEKPLTYQEIWKMGLDLGLDNKLDSKGKTPWQSLGAQLFTDIRDNEKTEFTKIGKRPARFFLTKNVKTLDSEAIIKIEKQEIIADKQDKIVYKERDLHPLLNYFAYTNTTFNRGKAIYTKTVYHEKSKKDGYNEWLHPDIVGFYIPLEDWSAETIELNKISNSNAIKLFSFELKKAINKSNYRESFFQAVSNSSWANEGYLVAAEIKEDDELLSELERLSIAFGIGIIKLDLEDIDSSYILYHSTPKKELDWETINKLAEINIDYKKFIQDVKIDFEAKRIHKSEYDKIIDDIDDYMKKMLQG